MLQSSNMLMLEGRKDINQMNGDYIQQAFVRANRLALPNNKESRTVAILPLPISQMEIASEDSVELFDGTASRKLKTLDANTALISHYLGRVISDSRGRYIVQSYSFSAEQESSNQRFESTRAPTKALKKIVVEPILDDYISSPRRQFIFDRKELPKEKDFEPRLFGSKPLGVHLQLYKRQRKSKVIEKGCWVYHKPVATLLLDSKTHQILERRILKPEDLRHQDKPLITDAVWLSPVYSIKEDLPTASLNFGGLRVLRACLKVLLPNFYRGAEQAFELGIHWNREAEVLPQREDELTRKDALVIFDLQAQGSGCAPEALADRDDAAVAVVGVGNRRHHSK